MNKRIKELVKQAEQYATDKANEGTDEDYEYSFDDDFQEKFADLIVRECAALAKSKSERIQSMETDDRGDQAQIHSLAWQFDEFGYEIKKHFGVEE